eukprot:TRINITY_DN3489_c1_g1_i2.p1 TRINITY_DN3489_c1_g1~~TRINITY_DN3489_c1_g1_i2.p1  ORF type:complete len:789 (-),score=200.12 TRINITY_DN3489_c1_g1_i2:101-2467(-)
MAEKDINKRVKVYKCTNNDWQDRGTGYVSLVTDAGMVFLEVEFEASPTELLRSRISDNASFTSQKDSLIVWTDKDTDEDLALSFQIAQGCSDFLSQIQNWQARSASVLDGWDQSSNLGDDSREIFVPSSADDDDATEIVIDIPPVNLNALEDIHKLFGVMHLSPLKDRFITKLLNQNYFGKLFDLFSLCEDLEDAASLRTLFFIFRSAVLINDPSIFELLFSDEYILKFMGVFEYDPGLGTKKRIPHREYIQKQAVFREVVPFNNEEILAKIHQTFRLTYLRDVVLVRFLDDASFNTLNSTITFNNTDIIVWVTRNGEYLDRLFSRFREAGLSVEDRKYLIVFLHEMMILAKNLQNIDVKARFFKVLCQHEYLSSGVIHQGLMHPDVVARLAAAGILDISLSWDSSMVRIFIIQEKHHLSSLMFFILKAFLSDREMGVRVQLGENLRNLLDVSNFQAESSTLMSGTSSEREVFLTTFYDRYVTAFLAPLDRDRIKKDPVAMAISDAIGDIFDTSREQDSGTRDLANALREASCEMLAFCIGHHGYRAKYFILETNIAGKISQLLLSKEKPVVLAAVRFLRSMIAAKDDYYNRHLIRFKLLDPLIEALKRNGARYNLLNSAILELFEYIRKENVADLIKYLGEMHGDYLKGIDYVETFQLLLIKYSQMQDYTQEQDTQSLASSNSTLSRSDGGDLDDEYFSKDDDIVTPPSTSVPSSPSEDREFKPMKRAKSPEDDTFVLKKSKVSLVDYSDEDDASPSTSDSAAKSEDKPQPKKKRGINFNLNKRSSS